MLGILFAVIVYLFLLGFVVAKRVVLGVQGGFELEALVDRVRLEAHELVLGVFLGC